MNAAVSRSYNGWEPLFSEEFSKDYFKGIKAFLEREYAQKTVYPPKKLILNAFDLTAPQDVKVVILGQDPYINPGQAMGLAFSVPYPVPPPPSLLNIFREIKEETGREVGYVIVNEAGASVYSASALGAEEFPDYDVSLRSAVSIARRLQDPLAELVKIDPKAIGVGQYQHDMPQSQLTGALDGVVEDCVNTVGVDLNTASAELLSHVSGIGGALSKNIVAYREENGKFTSRAQLKKVPKLGPKAFEQCAGFLKLSDGKQVLDGTSVHPESYDAAKELLKLCGITETDVRNGKTAAIRTAAETLGIESTAQRLNIGVPTLNDIIKELERPGRDPRDELPPPLLRHDIMSASDLKTGMELTGTVRNVIDFGAFVDIGVHQDGLVHISQITDRFIKHPSEVLKVGDVVKVWVLGVDEQKKRISLTMRKEKLNHEKQ